MKLSPPISPFDAAGSLDGASLARPLPRPPSKIKRFLHRHRGFLLVVALPTAIAAAYLIGVAAPQYESESRFLIRTRSGAAPSGNGGALGDMLGAAGFKPSQEDAMAVRDFLESRDALRGIQGSVNPVEIWRRPEADIVARLWDENPSTEKLLKYFRRMVDINHDAGSGVLTLRVRAFRPEDAHTLSEALLTQSEQLVNSMGERARESALNVARQEVERAEQRVIASRESLTDFRVRERAVDPTSEAAASLATVARLEGALLEARAELTEKSAYLRPDNPALRTVQNRVNALEQQARTERARITGGAAGQQALPQQLAGYERLMLEREFADKQLASATASQEMARVDAQRQQLFITRIVQPNVAESAEYPRVGFILGSLFVVLCVVYGVLWLVLAGVREHAA
ncbi:capsule biosynthesis protein [Roseomonas sp. BN140053]|uniref:capsule biosynthesis protein n=1 Tax=Roseomonas sp. BN140053 TaxID=3391898 RepID=UPI0039E95BB0